MAEDDGFSADRFGQDGMNARRGEAHFISRPLTPEELMGSDATPRDSGSTPRDTDAGSRDVGAEHRGTGKASRKPRASVSGTRPRAGVIIACLLLVVVLAAAGAGLYAWDRLWRYDDAADIQGVWRTTDWSMTVVITDDEIQFPAHVTWDYTLDQKSRTLDFTFTDLRGKATYSFSSDRNVLTIVQGTQDSAQDTVLVRVDDEAYIQDAPANLSGPPHGDKSASDTQEDA